MRSKLVFDIAYGNYKNQQENIHFIREMPIKQEVIETNEVVEMCSPHPPTPTPTPEAEKRKCKPKKGKAKHECDIVSKITFEKKEMQGKKRLFFCAT